MRHETACFWSPKNRAFVVACVTPHGATVWRYALELGFDNQPVDFSAFIEGRCPIEFCTGKHAIEDGDLTQFAIHPFHGIVAPTDDEWGGGWGKGSTHNILTDDLGIAPQGADA